MNSFTFCLLLFILTAPSTVQAGTKCQSRECISLSAQILSWMNKSADPCVNFYEYACGNFKRVIKYNPSNVFIDASQDWFSPSLDESTTTQILYETNRRTFEVLVRKGLATDKNPRITELYQMTEDFFESCTDWMRINEAFKLESSDSFIYGVSAHLVKVFDSHGLLVKENNTNTDNIAERIFAALIGSGADSFLKFELPKDFAEEAFLSNQDLRELSRAKISVTYQQYPTKAFDIQPIMNFFNKTGAPAPWPYEFTNEQFSSEIDGLRNALSVNTRNRFCFRNLSDENILTVSELEQFSQCDSPNASFSWMKLFKYLLRTEIDDSAKVVVLKPTAVIKFANYFKNHLASVTLTSLFKSTKVRLLVYDWLLGFSSFLPKKLMEILRRNRIKKFNFEQDSCNPFDTCIKQTKTYLGPLVSKMYHQVFLSQTAFDKVNNLIKMIVNATIELINKQKWITDYGKEAMVDKMKAMKHHIGFKEVTDDELLKFYSESLREFRMLQMRRPRENYGRLLALSLMSYSRKNFDLLSGKTPVSVFDSFSPWAVNAAFYPNNNVALPMALLTPPVFHETFPNYANLAELGSVVGHEIGHGINQVGVQIRSTGNRFEKLLDNETHYNYMNISICIRNQFANQYDDVFLGEIYADKTMSEDIADVLSSGPSFHALRSPSVGNSESDSELPNLSELGATQQQLYFILNAQQWCKKSEPLVEWRREPQAHSEMPMRVNNGLVMNSDEFSEAFKCEAGAPMNPVEKCKFW